MNYQDKLMTLAREVAAEYAQKPGMEAILLTGSVAHGRTDGVSDVDMMLYFHELPSPEQLEREKETAVASGGGIYSYEPGEGLACYHFINGTKVDFGYQTSSELATLLEAFVAEPSVDDKTHHIIMSGIQTGVPLFGEPMLREWQAKLAALPPSFGQALVERHLRFSPVAVAQEMGADRKDYGLVYELLLEMVPNVLNVLCGLNGLIPPGKIKGLDSWLAKMTVTLPNIRERMAAIWTVGPETAVSHFYAIVHDLIGLVETQMPQVDTQPVRRRLQLQLRQYG